MLAGVALAGGDPRQVLVVTNGDDPSATAIADHYATSRTLPPQHICAISGLPEAATSISFADYEALVAPAIDACLAALPAPHDIHILVTTRGLPYRVELDASYVVGFEALLQIHRATAFTDGSPLAGSPQTDLGGYFAASVSNPTYVGALASTHDCDFTESNDYARWYSAACVLLNRARYPLAFFRHTDWDDTRWQLNGNLFIVTRLDGFDADDAMDLVDRGVAADGTWPDAPLWCMHGADPARGARDPECEMVVRYLQYANLSAEWIDTFDPALSGHAMGGYLTGAAEMTGAIAGNHYEPGAITDNITSYGAVASNFFCDASGETCPESEVQTSVARFIRAGATGAHGTVAEPLNNVFPNATLYLLYTAGYSLGESYLFSQRYLYWQNLTLGDPLTTPHATRPVLYDGPETAPAEGEWTATATHAHGITWTGAYLDDQLIAEASGPDLVISVDQLGAMGDTVDVYVVAEAAASAQSRPGWPVDPITPTPGVRGWRWFRIAIGPPDTAESDTGTPAGSDTGVPATPTEQEDTGNAKAAPSAATKRSSGSCATLVQPLQAVSALTMLLALALRRRREPFAG